jgi:hypothetical protein
MAWPRVTLTGIAQTLEMLIETEDFSRVASHGGEDAGGVEQAGVANGDRCLRFVDEVAVEPDRWHK